jgi:hypothetical protein
MSFEHEYEPMLGGKLHRKRFTVFLHGRRIRLGQSREFAWMWRQHPRSDVVRLPFARG